MTTALVTGGAGFIGSNLVDRLVDDEGWNVIVVDNQSAECNEKFYWRLDTTNYRIDVTDYDALSAVCKKHNPKHIFHLAAESRIQPAIENPIRACQVNIIGTCNVLQVARNIGARVMYSSTSAAYGLKNIPPLTEDMPTDCLNPYSVSKVAGEELCKMYYDLFDTRVIIFRYFNVYGPRQPVKGQYAPVIGLFMRQKQECKKMTVVGDGLQRRDYTHVDDVVKANVLAAKSDNSKVFGNIFNVGTGINHSVIDLVNLLKGDYEFIPLRPGEARITLADITRVQEHLNWHPDIQLEDYIDDQNI